MMNQAFRRRGVKAAARLALTLAAVVSGASLLSAKGPSVRQENGKYFDKEDTVTYNVKDDGAVDWYTYSGFRRYHSECHVCHGPDALGSSYAPALAESMKTLSYSDYLNIVASGRKNVSANQNSYMPAFGENLNVMCYAEDIFIYLKARADDAIPRGRPEKREDKPEPAKDYEKSCLGR